jgi:hypothetical protein
VGKGTYLIIIPDQYSHSPSGVGDIFNNFVKWKRQKGYNVVVHLLPQSPNPSYQQIINIINDAYQTSNPPLEYVLLVADVNGGTTIIPSDMIQNPDYGTEYDPTDHSYTLLEGDDYFPEIFIGRISVTNYNEANVIFSKSMNYEKNPYLLQTPWHNKMLAVGGNYADTGFAPITPCQTSWWMADYFLMHGFVDADTILYWGPNDPNPGSPLEIAAAINGGVSYVVYRGWADAAGWQHPVYNINYITPQYMQNSWKMPIFGSFVCNTGNFASEVNPCFGEKLLRFGTPTSGGGAVAFIGPSDLHTNTNFNNAISSGWCEGLLEMGLTNFAAASTYGKMSLWEAFPDDRQSDGFVNFYFHVYNCLGDPELDMWTSIPDTTMSLTTSGTLTVGATTMHASVSAGASHIPGAYVSILVGDQLIAGDYTDNQGEVDMHFSSLASGTLTITATKYGYKPTINIVTVSASNFVGLYADSLLNETHPDYALNPGETATLRVTLKNYGSDAQNNVTGLLSLSSNFVTTPSNPVSFGNISAGGTAQANFPLIVINQIAGEGVNLDFESLVFDLDISSSAGNYSAVVSIPYIADEMELWDAYPMAGPIYHGDTGPIQIMVRNTGAFTMENATAYVQSNDEQVTVLQENGIYGTIANGQIASNTGNPFIVQIAEGVAEGHIANMLITISAPVGETFFLPFTFVVGTPDSCDPTGPDAYGYYAFDSNDIYYTQRPVFDWIELDPNIPGHITGASRLYLGDDSSTYVPLPFDFTYYGQSYDHITICSNGWVSFTQTWMADFRNWDIPSPLGPPALVAVFWDDLKDTTDGELDVYYYYDPTGKFIVEWSRVHNRFQDPNNRLETFEVILFDPDIYPTITNDGEIVVQYLEVADVDYDNNFSTVGIENYYHTTGLEYLYCRHYDTHPTACVLDSGLAIKFTTIAPENFAEVEELPEYTPTDFALPQNYPNPFNSSTIISFDLREASFVNLSIYDISGREVASIVNGQRSMGAHQVVWDAEGLPSGIYFVKLKVDNGWSSVRKMLLLK